MSDEVLALIDSEEVRALMGNVTNLWGALRMTVKMMRRVGPLQKMMVADTWRTTQAVRPDLIIFHPKTYTGTHFAEKLGIPSILAPTLPQFAPTSEFVAMGFPNLPLGGWYNRLSYVLTTRLTVLGVGGYTNAWRKENDLPPQRRGTNFLLNQDRSPIPVIHPLSRYVIRVPEDWPDYIHATGYWFLDEPTAWQPPADLQDFLDAGDPPVYVGFGSMVGPDPRQITETIVAGLQKAGVRGILATGWGGLTTGDLPDTIFKLDQAPHSWLFPRMAAVVHHGGAGTTAAGLRAGKPTLICPYFGDQPFWGQRIFALGVGPEPIHQKQLTVEGFTKSIITTTTDLTLQQKAATLGEKIRSEDGVANAISIINNYS
jgi:sterol 3beta-glucosyltransferase